MLIGCPSTQSDSCIHHTNCHHFLFSSPDKIFTSVLVAMLSQSSCIYIIKWMDWVPYLGFQETTKCFYYFKHHSQGSNSKTKGEQSVLMSSHESLFDFPQQPLWTWLTPFLFLSYHLHLLTLTFSFPALSSHWLHMILVVSFDPLTFACLFTNSLLSHLSPIMEDAVWNDYLRLTCALHDVGKVVLECIWNDFYASFFFWVELI